VQLPIGAEEHFRGVVDLVEMNAITYKDDLGQNWTWARSRPELPRAGRTSTTTS
jgi:elongation factor G